MADGHNARDEWELPDHIRPLALCVFRREDGAFLMAPGWDRVKQQRFYRPLGGGIEFGERAADAAKREIREELGAEVEIDGLLGIFENIFVYRGKPGHELVWTFEAHFLDRAFYENDVIDADESGSPFEVHWVRLDALGDAPVYPDGLLELISGQQTATIDS